MECEKKKEKANGREREEKWKPQKERDWGRVRIRECHWDIIQRLVSMHGLDTVEPSERNRLLLLLPLKKSAVDAQHCCL